MIVAEVISFYTQAMHLCRVGMVNKEEFLERFGKIGPSLLSELGINASDPEEARTLPASTKFPPNTEKLVNELKDWVKQQANRVPCA